MFVTSAFSDLAHCVRVSLLLFLKTILKSLNFESYNYFKGLPIYQSSKIGDICLMKCTTIQILQILTYFCNRNLKYFFVFHFMPNRYLGFPTFKGFFLSFSSSTKISFVKSDKHNIHKSC